ncbi:MAG: N-acetylmuramoyl-L-alanine amidase, partial [Selenomonadaceae bacterium]|nr:N-acetylmuramoyl-L-alanine amidase [Selenomonadaceae bacterium]
RSNWKFFYAEEMPDDEGRLNVSSQFIVGRDGTIWRLMPETKFARHAIGYNHCAIGIENVGGFGGQEDLTEAQLIANVRLIKYLHAKYPTIEYVFGHYQQDVARASGLYIEHVANYYAGKPDPGSKFMRGLRAQLESDGLIFYDD